MKSIVLLVIFGGAISASAATGFVGDSHFITTPIGGANVSKQITTGTSCLGSGAAPSSFLAADDLNARLGSNIPNTGGANPAAGFTNIPEAASSILGLIGAVLLLRRRR